ncbi:MAG TPA: TerC family protein [Steroidobacteraceae bacterium]|nr:TerC family protein [Steroidobacteraceae bacterium]
MEIFTAQFLTALLQVMLVNIVLSGDNAVVIALAARNLEPRHRRLAILWGSLGAIVLRVILTVVAIQLLRIPFLQFIGALLLVWIAVKLLIEGDDPEHAHEAHANLFSAIRTILIADVVMSLDNTLAIAGVAQGDASLLIIGLVLSVPLIVLGSTLIMKIMERLPIVVYLGAGLIAWTAGEMIDSDAAVRPYLPGIFHHTYWLPLGITVAVIAFGWWRNRRN